MARKSTICNIKLNNGNCPGRLIAINVLAEGLQVRCSRCSRNFILKMRYGDYLKIKSREDRRGS